MKKYRVYAKNVYIMYVDVEAENEDAAREVAESLDAGDFKHNPGDFEHDEKASWWELGDIEEIKHGK